MSQSVKEKLKGVSFVSLRKALGSVWRRIFAIVAWIFLLLSIAFITYVGYISLEVDHSNAEKDQVYIQGQEAKARFNERSYDELRGMIKVREENLENNPPIVADIFYTPGVGEKEEEEKPRASQVQTLNNEQESEPIIEDIIRPEGI